MTGPPTKRDRNARIRRRVSVSFGTSLPLRDTGFSTNVSARGIGISSNVAYPPRTPLMFELKLPGGLVARVKGEVAWSQRGSRTLNLQSLMGIKVLEADDFFRAYVDTAWRDPSATVVGGPGTTGAPPAPPGPLNRVSGQPAASPAGTRPPPAPASTRPPPAPGATRPPLVPPAPAPVAPLLEVPPDVPDAKPRLVRFQRSLDTWFGIAGHFTHEATTENVSGAGLAIRARAAARKGTKLSVKIRTPLDHEAIVKAEVVWMQHGGGDVPSRLGLQILEKDRAYTMMVEHLEKTPGPGGPAPKPSGGDDDDRG